MRQHFQITNETSIKREIFFNKTKFNLHQKEYKRETFLRKGILKTTRYESYATSVKIKLVNCNEHLSISISLNSV